MSDSTSDHRDDRTRVANLILALRRLNTTLVATNRAVSAHLGVKEGDLAVLDLLHQSGPQTPSDLARKLRTHTATMTGILARLEQGGWIKRVHDASDRRSVRIHPVSVDRLNTTYARTNEQFAELVDDWPNEDIATLTTFVDSVATISERLAMSLSPTPASLRGLGHRQSHRSDARHAEEQP